MKNQIHLASNSEARRGNARSTLRRCRGDWRVLLLAGCCAVLSGLARPTRAAVTEAWAQRYNGPANLDDRASAVAVDGSGNVVVTGASATGYEPFWGFIYDYYTAKYAVADGALLWEKRYNGPADYDDVANAIAVDGSGNVVVTGYSSNGTNYDFYTAKYAAADGALLWEKRYKSGGQAVAVAVDGSGNVVVTGSSYNGTNSDYYTAKYAAADGALLWEKRYNGPANSGDGASAVALDSGGNVVVTGYSSNGTNADYYTAKYAAVDGALLWEKRYNGPANHTDEASAVVVDGSGNVVVTGYSDGGAISYAYDFYTAKYAAADGALLWEKRYNRLSNRENARSSLAVDVSGNVVVTGYSENGTNSDYCTANYAAADGALLWEKLYNGPANSYDYATAVVVDCRGNVIVTGSSDGDYYTAKYASADGALLWEERYHGGSATSLALGPNGMVVVTGSSDGNLSSGYAYDYATVVYRETLPPVAIALVSTGIRLRFTGVPGRSYNIERAPAVSGPWTTLATPSGPLDGLIEFVDTNAPAGTAFYRTSAP